MEPVRIRLYGLFPTTRRSYVLQLVLAAVLCAGLLIFRLVMPPFPVPEELARKEPSHVLIMGFWSNMPWIVLGLASLQAVEALFVLRRFAREEALQQAGPAASQLPNPNPG
jgi:hypothetical protein